MEVLYLQPVMNGTETAVAFVKKENDMFSLNIYSIESSTNKVIQTSLHNYEQLFWLQQDLFYIQNGTLYKWQQASNTFENIAKCSMAQQFEDNTYAFFHEAKVTIMQQHTVIQTFEADALIPMTGKGLLLLKGEQYYLFDGEFTACAMNGPIKHAARSFTGTHIAYFGEEYGQLQLFVYDLQMNIIQNMTEYLGETLGNGLTKHTEHALCPVWTELDAFYFLVTANDEVRLYYGDLYGTLLPASPENQCVYGYTISKNGNWCFNTLFLKDGSSNLVYLDITTGEEQRLFL